MEDYALGLHLRDAAVDVMLLHLEVGNAVAEQPAGPGVFFVDVNLVAGARELLRAGKSGRPRADDRNAFAGPLRRRLGLEPLGDGPVGDRAFDRFDGDRVLIDVERARRFARRRADAAGHFRKVVGRVQIARGLVPVAGVDEVVPVRDLVVDRAARRAGRERAGALAIGHAAIHAARRLDAVFVVLERQYEFAPVAHALLDRLVVTVVAFVFEEPGDLAHATSACTPARIGCCLISACAPRHR